MNYGVQAEDTKKTGLIFLASPILFSRVTRLQYFAIVSFGMATTGMKEKRTSNHIKNFGFLKLSVTSKETLKLLKNSNQMAG